MGHRFWGSGVNFESKALIAALAFQTLGMHRLTAWANTRNGRSQVALERLGFRREGTLAGWHRHGEQVHDVVVFGMLRPGWERSRLRAIEATVSGEPPAAFKVA
jgi:ribosomal-protein-alanine N-acetyltransferase